MTLVFVLVYAALAIWGVARLWRAAARITERGSGWWLVTVSVAAAGFVIGFILTAIGFVIATNHLDPALDLGISDTTFVAWVAAGGGLLGGFGGAYSGTGRVIPALVGAAAAALAAAGAFLWAGSPDPSLAEVAVAGVAAVGMTVAGARLWRTSHTDGVEHRRLPLQPTG